MRMGGARRRGGEWRGNWRSGDVAKVTFVLGCEGVVVSIELFAECGNSRICCE